MAHGLDEDEGARGAKSHSKVAKKAKATRKDTLSLKTDISHFYFQSVAAGC
jgi:hypothetical protein